MIQQPMLISMEILAGSILCFIGGKLVTRDSLSPFSLFSYFLAATFLIRPLFLFLGLVEFRVPGLLEESLSDLILKGTGLFVIGYAAALIGFLSSEKLGVLLVRKLPRFEVSPRHGMLSLLVAAGLALSVALYLVGLVQYGSIGNLMIAARTGGWQGNQLAALVTQNTSALAAIAFGTARLTGKMRASFYYFMSFLTALLITLLLADRSGVVVPVLAFIIAYHYRERWKLTVSRFLAVIVCVLTFATALSVFRVDIMSGGTNSEGDERSEMVTTAANVISGGVNLQSYDHFLILVQDGHRHGLAGDHFLKGLIAVVPRAIWPSKPSTISPGVWFSEEYFGSESTIGRPFTNLGIWLVNFGVLGVILGMMLSGIILRVLNEWLHDTKTLWAKYYIVWVTLLVFIGGFAPALPTQIIKWAIPLYFAYLLATQRSRVVQRAV